MTSIRTTALIAAYGQEDTWSDDVFRIYAHNQPRDPLRGRWKLLVSNNLAMASFPWMIYRMDLSNSNFIARSPHKMAAAAVAAAIRADLMVVWVIR